MPHFFSPVFYNTNWSETGYESISSSAVSCVLRGSCYNSFRQVFSHSSDLQTQHLPLCSPQRLKKLPPFTTTSEFIGSLYKLVFKRISYIEVFPKKHSLPVERRNWGKKGKPVHTRHQANANSRGAISSSQSSFFYIQKQRENAVMETRAAA